MTPSLPFRSYTHLNSPGRTEHVNQSKKRDAPVASLAASPQSNSTVAEPHKIPQIQYHEINLNGGAYERALLWKLRWSSLTSAPDTSFRKIFLISFQKTPQPHDSRLQNRSHQHPRPRSHATSWTHRTRQRFRRS